MQQDWLSSSPYLTCGRWDLGKGSNWVWVGQGGDVL